MQNAEMKVSGDMLTIKIDLSQRHGPSGSGKSLTIATTGGNMKVPDNPDIKIGLNCYVKNPDYKESAND